MPEAPAIRVDPLSGEPVDRVTPLVRARGTEVGVRTVRMRGVQSIVLETFNIFDAKVSDIDYFYRSRLPGEAAEGVGDIHLHPALPRSARLGIQLSF